MARKSLKTFISSLLALLVLGACASTNSARDMRPSSEYIKLAENLSVEDELYNGFTNIFHYSATLLTEDLSESQLVQLKKAKLWSDNEFKKEQRRVIESIGNETKVFLSFYTPEIRFNDLNESSSVWRIFLDVDGKRYTATISKHSKNYADTRSLYPKHTPWGKPYLLRFPVPYDKVEAAKKARLVITGSLGVSKKEFKL